MFWEGIGVVNHTGFQEGLDRSGSWRVDMTTVRTPAAMPRCVEQLQDKSTRSWTAEVQLYSGFSFTSVREKTKSRGMLPASYPAILSITRSDRGGEQLCSGLYSGQNSGQVQPASQWTAQGRAQGRGSHQGWMQFREKPTWHNVRRVLEATIINSSHCSD